jgi:hypothetical protein
LSEGSTTEQRLFEKCSTVKYTLLGHGDDHQEMAVTIESPTVSEEHSDRSSAGERKITAYANEVVEDQ